MLGPEEGHLTGLEKAREGSLEGECLSDVKDTRQRMTFQVERQRGWHF